MSLALPCTSCGMRNPEFRKLIMDPDCDGIGREDISNFSDETGSCYYWVSPRDAEWQIQKEKERIQKIKDRKAAAIERAHAPLKHNPFKNLILPLDFKNFKK